MTAAVAEPANTHPANSQVDKEDRRTYTHPRTGETWTSVTTYLQAMPKPGLPYWAARETAAAAMDQAPRIVRSALIRPCGKGTADDRCHECPPCVEYALRLTPEELRDSAGDRGTRVHKLAELYVATGEMGAHDDDIAPYVAQYLAWTELVKPTWEATEGTVINRRHGYAGTFDGIVRLGNLPPKYKALVGEPLVVDLKTAKGTYPDNAMQLAAYRHGEAILLPDGTEIPMPPTAGGIVVHLRPEFFQTHYVAAADEDLDGFLTVKHLHDWLATRGKVAVERAMYKPRATKPALTAVPDPAPAKPVPARPAPAANESRPALMPPPPPDDDIPF